MIKYLVLIMLFISCGREDQRQQKCVAYGENCDKDDSTETKTEPTVVYTPGPRGAPGEDGQDGFNTLLTVTTVTGCTTFIAALDINRNNVIDSADENWQAAEVCNGADGAVGQDGTDGVDGAQGEQGEAGVGAPVEFAVVEMKDPCGDAPGIYDEILLKLGSGKLIASFSDNANGQNTRFSVLTAGSYRTTDGSNCYFSVDSNNAVVNEHY